MADERERAACSKQAAAAVAGEVQKGSIYWSERGILQLFPFTWKPFDLRAAGTGRLSGRLLSYLAGRSLRGRGVSFGSLTSLAGRA